MTTSQPEAPPVACRRCGDTAGPWAITDDGLECETCTEQPSATAPVPGGEAQ